MDKLSKHSIIMSQFKDIITKEKACAVKIDATQKQWPAMLDAAQSRTQEDFVVVIMGNFSAGKSTMINALIGERVLPSYPIPTTAVMTELRYGEEKKIIMYPKKGENIEGYGDKPFTVPATEDAIEKYITIDNEAGVNCKPEDSVEIASKFEKMELYWPLEMLKNGVVIVDSPGLNDPYSNDVIVKKYVPKADAIIYALNGTNPYQGTDKKELDALNAYGIQNIIFACTYWDMVCCSGERAASKTRSYCISSALKHTALTESAVHFLASRDGLRAQIEQDEDLWIKSGYKEFSAYLQDYLTNRKGRDKVKNITAAVITLADSMKKHAAVLDENAKKDKQLIGKNVALAQEKLKGLENDAKTIHTTFVLKMENQKPAIEVCVKSGLRALKDKVDLEDFTPNTEFRKGLAKLNPFGKNKLAQTIAQEFQDEYKARIEKELLKYQSTVVSQKMQDAVRAAAESVEEDIKMLDKELDSIDAAIGMPNVGITHGNQGGKPLLGIAYGLITGDWWTGGSIALYGGAGRQIGLQFGTAAGLGVAIALGAPITLPVAVVALIAANIAAIFLDNNEKRVNSIRKETTEQLRKAYFGDGDDKFIDPTARSIMERVEVVFEKASGDVKDVISDVFTQKEQVFEAMLKQAELDTGEQEKLMEERKTAIAELDKIVQEASALDASY